MFEVNNETLDLRFDRHKVKNVEAAMGISLMSEIVNNRGMLSLNVLEGLFTVGLFSVSGNHNVTGKKAADIFDTLIEQIGYTPILEATVGKLEADMGFLFRSN